ncbi:hypothetical protein K1719_014744 [Acacia pycnantha]|nr:hypothetical protein K1719_014744 [Acacia pycnantha]
MDVGLAALLARDKKVVLVGRSYRGLNIALAAAACIFPHKTSLTLFLTDTIHRPSYVLEQFLEKIPSDTWLDTEFCDRGRLKTQHVVRSKGLIVPSLSTMLQRGNSSWLPPSFSLDDVEMAKALMRPSSYFVDNLSKENIFSQEGFG